MLPFVTAEAKVRPVIYLKRPHASEDPKAASDLSRLLQQKRPRKAVREILSEYANDKPFLRKMFLPEGYLFSDNAEIATAMAQETRLTDLYDEPIVYRQKNNITERLVRRGDHFVDPDGAEATIYLNDRTALKSTFFSAPIHLDIKAVIQSTGAVRVLPKIVDRTAAEVDLIFPSGNRYPALISLVDDQTQVTCIEGDEDQLRKEKMSAEIFRVRHEKIVEAVRNLVAERPIFDEPKDEGEDVQEDGELRVAWKEAYFSHKKKFKYREVEYEVFDKAGNPIPPEVCVDFIVDTWERAFGTWYAKRSKPPSRIPGEIDFYAVANLSRRHIASILTYALSEDTPFERYDVPQRKWIPLASYRRFIKNLVKLSLHFRVGDLLVIHGLRDEDEQEHFHTVLILSMDPITGIPVEVADNQGRPRISTLKTAMRAAPRRSIKYRLRLDFDKMITLTQKERERAASESAQSTQ